MKNIIIAIGGTGCRVLKPLMYYIASDQWSGQNEFIPIIIDNDTTNPAYTSVNELISNYNGVKETFKKQNENIANNRLLHKNGVLSTFRDEENPTFFKNKIIFNPELQTITSRVLNDNVYKLATALGAHPNGYGTEQEFLKYFFSESESTQSIKNGFYGMPNVGTVAYDDNFYGRIKILYQNFNLEQNKVRVFIIGSIFGGTGAAGIAKIYDYMKNDTAHPAINSAEYHLVPLMPYFTLQRSNENDRIDSTLWNTKARYALEYYFTKYQNSENTHLFIASPDIGNLPSYPYGEEGIAQINPPHRLELDAAYAICKSISSEDWPDIEGTPDDRYKLFSILFLAQMYNGDYEEKFKRVRSENTYFEGHYRIDGGEWQENEMRSFFNSLLEYFNGIRGQFTAKINDETEITINFQDTSGSLEYWNGLQANLHEMMDERILKSNRDDVNLDIIKSKYDDTGIRRNDITQSAFVNCFSKIARQISINQNN